MNVFMKTSTDKRGLWYVFCHDPSFYLGPYPSERAAEQVKNAVTLAYFHGWEEIQEGMRDLLGLSDVGN